jgi:hypothetical protein
VKLHPALAFGFAILGEGALPSFILAVDSRIPKRWAFDATE